MNNSMNNRYQEHQQILAHTNGTLYYGEDVSLRRTVLLYRTKSMNTPSVDEYIQRFGKTASFVHDSFHHILDTSRLADSLLIVLQFRQGKPLREQLNKPSRTFSSVVTMAAELGVAMLDALEEQITGYSIDVDNLWLSDDGKLSILTYWEDGLPHTQGAVGLCRLLVQLLSGSKPIPGPFEALHTHLERMEIASAKLEQKDALVKLIKRVCQGQASLSAMVFELRGLLSAGNVKAEAPSALNARSARVRTEVRSIEQKEDLKLEEELEEEEEDMRSEQSSHSSPSPRSNKAWLWSTGAVLALILLVWAIWPSDKSQPVTATISTKPIPTPSHAASPTPNAQPKQTAGSNRADGSGDSEPEETTIPNLVGLDQAAAEQAALSAGLHYNYLLEANDQENGSVFKQDPQPGSQAYKGDSITFWVSKGSQ
ncbi:PASTA domain-containing protein [Paenibacillus hexagrammi]|uniref:PASTA domain-containing protein n=1 Tax=Paenibacillus hexagrammi TaxID=2908839 RepID=A0ABY3SF41_9BACL|nr:PASTA domain-containing protein [Paenibacillus sp. YPD9-1]UJF31690.1 PASTA domain-containing protein [Paenibacillus sp. YPD9-1]